MLRIKRKDNELIFELKPPFDDIFFTELQSTISDFMKIGKKSFTYDFKRVDEISPEIAEQFEIIIPTLRSGKCHLDILNSNDEIMNALPEHKLFVEKAIKEYSRSSNFELKIDVNDDTSVAIISLSGEFIDQKSLDTFKSSSTQLISQVQVIVIDFSKLDHISTIAIGGLIYLKVQCDKENQKSLICNASKPIKATLEMSGILQVFPVFDSLKEALNSIK